MENSLAHRSLVPLDIEGRDQSLPKLYEYEGRHPLRPVGIPHGRTIIILIDGSDDGKKRELERVKELGILQGTLEGMDRRHPGVSENGAERHLMN